MPPTRQPNKLYTICNNYVNTMLIHIIFLVSVSPESEIDSKLQSLQDYILKNIHPHLVDNILQTIDPLTPLNENQKIMLLKVLMHPAMNSFNVKFKLPSKDNFYEVRLKDINRLVVLNLNLVCTDEILEVVGSNCHLLQIVNIVSKIGSVTNKMKKQLNALKLKFFVSDIGLQHLHKCKFLKTIVMNKVSRSNCGGGKITHDGIRKLLNALPCVQFISYNDMGLVLENMDGNKRFNLLHLHDSHVKPEHIDEFLNHCPKLKGLCLMLPTISPDFPMPEICLAKLAESELNLSSLSLGLFPVEQSFIKFLSVKGNYLTNLNVSHYITITVQTIFYIGQYCPFLKYLEVNLVLPNNFEDETVNITPNKKFFTCLQSLKIIGSNWDPHIVIPLCIHNATYLNHLILINKDYYRYIDKLILNLMKINSLANLQSVSLLDGFCVTSKTIEKFILGMKNVKSVVVTKGSGYADHLEKLKVDNNLDFTIISDCMLESDIRNYGNCFCYYWQMGVRKY